MVEYGNEIIRFNSFLESFKKQESEMYSYLLDSIDRDIEEWCYRNVEKINAVNDVLQIWDPMHINVMYNDPFEYYNYSIVIAIILNANQHLVRKALESTFRYGFSPITIDPIEYDTVERVLLSTV